MKLGRPNKLGELALVLEQMIAANYSLTYQQIIDKFEAQTGFRATKSIVKHHCRKLVRNGERVSKQKPKQWDSPLPKPKTKPAITLPPIPPARS